MNGLDTDKDAQKDLTFTNAMGLFCFTFSWLHLGQPFRKVECLGDLQGPKFRVGELAGEPIPLKDGDILEFGICKAGPIWGINNASRLAIARFRFRLGM